MKRRKVPNQVYQGTREAAQHLFRYEPIERYVIATVNQAGKQDVAVDEIFITLAEKILAQRPVHYFHKESLQVA